MKEIEILVRVLEPKKSALKKLSKFKCTGKKRVYDKYYYHPANKNMQWSKKLGLTEFFRVRRKGDKAYITYKKDVFKNKSWLYSDEYETEISNPETMEKIIEMLKLKPFVTVDNNRTFFYHDDYEITFEDVKGLGIFLEVERLNLKDEKPEDVRKDIFKFIDSTGIKVSEEMISGKPELMYNKIHHKKAVEYWKNM